MFLLGMWAKYGQECALVSVIDLLLPHDAIDLEASPTRSAEIDYFQIVGALLAEGTAIDKLPGPHLR